jgi:DNA-nicking Smr family endonuclease
MPKPTPKTEEDAVNFATLVGPVRPVTVRALPLVKPKPKPKARFRRLDDRAVLEESLRHYPGDEWVDTGEELQFRRDYIASDTLRKLRRGDFSVESNLDLHGLTVDASRELLKAFLFDCRKRHLGCVRVVHGKGLRSGPRGPVIKRAINHWLQRVDFVIAFASAPQRDGGTGAIYVLLDNRTNPLELQKHL